MKSSLAILTAGILAVIQAGTSVSETSDQTAATRDRIAEQELRDLERRTNQESLAGNTSTFSKMVSTDYIGMSDDISNGKYQWAPVDREAFAKGVVDTSSRLANAKLYDLEARVHCKTDVVRGRAVLKLKDGRVYESYFLDTWENRKGQWIQAAGSTSTQQTH